MHFVDRGLSLVTVGDTLEDCSFVDLGRLRQSLGFDYAKPHLTPKTPKTPSTKTSVHAIRSNFRFPTSVVTSVLSQTCSEIQLSGENEGSSLVEPDSESFVNSTQVKSVQVRYQGIGQLLCKEKLQQFAFKDMF